MKSIRLFLMMLVLAGFSAAGAFAQTTEQGFAYLESGQQANARKFFSERVSQTPTPDNMYYMGEFYMAIGQPDSAKAQFDKALAADPKNALATVGLGEVALAKNDAAGAAQQFKQAAKLSKNKSGEVYFRIAEAYRRAKNTKEAASNYEKAVDLDKSNAWYYVTIGDFYFDNNDGSKAAQNYERAKYYNKNYAKAYLRAGYLFEAAKDYNQALQQYNEGAVADPNFPQIYKALGEVYYKARQYDKAAENYMKYTQMTGNQPDDVFILGGYYFLQSKYPETVQTLSALGDDYKNPVIHRLLGRSYFEQKDYTNAVQQLDQFMTEAPADNLIDSDYLYYGRALIAAGKDTLKGIQQLNLYAQKDTAAAADIYREGANMLFASRKYNEAANQYKVMKDNGVDLSANDYFKLGVAYYSTGDFPKADSAFAYVTENASQTPTGWMWRAYTNAKMDPDVTQGLAKPYYEKYIELASAEPDKNKQGLVSGNVYLMIYYYKKEDKENALKYANAVLALDPNHAGAKELAEVLAQAK